MIEQLTLEVAELYAPVYPEGATWEETARFLMEHEPERMDELRESIKKHGFREAIVLSTPEDLEDESQPLVLNGTHRLVIALLEGMVSIPTELMSEVNARIEDEPQLAITVEALQGELSDEEEDLIIDRLSSWPLNDKCWINSSCAFGGAKRWEIILDNGAPSDSSTIRTRARQILKKALPHRKLKVTVAPYEA